MTSASRKRSYLHTIDFLKPSPMFETSATAPAQQYLIGLASSRPCQFVLKRSGFFCWIRLDADAGFSGAFTSIKQLYATDLLRHGSPKDPYFACSWLFNWYVASSGRKVHAYSGHCETWCMYEIKLEAHSIAFNHRERRPISVQILSRSHAAMRIRWFAEAHGADSRIPFSPNKVVHFCGNP